MDRTDIERVSEHIFQVWSEYVAADTDEKRDECVGKSYISIQRENYLEYFVYFNYDGDVFILAEDELEIPIGINLDQTYDKEKLTNAISDGIESIYYDDDDETDYEIESQIARDLEGIADDIIHCIGMFERSWESSEYEDEFWYESKVQYTDALNHIREAQKILNKNI